MKKNYLFHILFVAVIAVFGLSSCDEESIEPTLLNEELVGESLIRITYQDTLIIKRNVIAKIDEKGVFSFSVGTKKKDALLITTMRFEEGLFPSNINVASYFFSEINDIGRSFDMNKPMSNTGWIRISAINKVAKVVSGEFKVKIYPPLDPEKPMLNSKPFEIEGEFRNLRYQLEQGDFFVTKIEGKDWVYKNRSVQVMNGRVVIATTNEITEENMEFSFDKNLEEGTYALDKFAAKYVSTAGVSYTTNAELAGSTLTITENKENRVKGSFQLKMKNASGSQTLNFTEGSFNLAY